jgi:hypothetical protein
LSPRLRKLLALALLLPLAPLAAATGGGSTSSQSFRLARGARATGLGDAYSALASGADAMAWNPAGLNSVRDLQVAASHLGYLEGINVDTIQLAKPIYGMGAWGLGLDYLYASDQGYDNWGNSTGDFSLFDFSAQIAVSLDLPWDISVGAVYKTLRQGYGSQFAMGSGFDVGFQRRALFGRLDLGLVASNIGTPMALGAGYGILPVTFKGGAALHLTDAWLVSADYDLQAADFFNKVHTGTELTLPAGPTTVAVRGGYTFGPQQDLGGLSGLAAGLGVQYGAWTVDYAWQPLGDLGNTHRVSLTWSSWVL